MVCIGLIDTGGLPLFRFTLSGGGDSSVDPYDDLCDAGVLAPCAAPPGTEPASLA